MEHRAWKAHARLQYEPQLPFTGTEANPENEDRKMFIHRTSSSLKQHFLKLYTPEEKNSNIYSYSLVSKGKSRLNVLS